MNVRIRPATASDFDALAGKRPPCRVRAFAAELETGELLGVGGLAYAPELPPGTLLAFVDSVEGARRYRIAMHKAGLAAMAEARRLRVPRLLATADPAIEASGRWLERLGFEPTGADVDGHPLYLWELSRVE